MITKIESYKRRLAKHDWLTTYYLFSFANYFDPNNIQFGTLRVFNDDTIAPHSGFGEHQHDNMEIITIVLQGQLTHKDSMGNTGVIRAGEVQRMSAGTGVVHAEMNDGDTPVHLYQIWIFPREQNLAPSYEQKDFSNISNKNVLLPLASGLNHSGTLKINTDATVYNSELETGQSIEHKLNDNRGAFIYLQEGSLDINGTKFKEHDQARISNENKLTIIADKTSKFVLIDAPKVE
jgi:quercetin 2,3-dioxygenase